MVGRQGGVNSKKCQIEDAIEGGFEADQGTKNPVEVTFSLHTYP